jgi:hypothetical protein
LTAQSSLPWEGAQELPWETAVPGPLPSPLPPEPEPAAKPAQRLVHLTGDGTLRISDARGRVHLRLGLSGRPILLLRDAGVPMILANFPCLFPAETPLTKGLGNFPLVSKDFRAALRGLLWILDDGERRITLVHPATSQVVYLPLPPGEDWDLYFYPDRLELRRKPVPGGEPQEIACWSLPWLILLPEFVRLSLPASGGNQGTAFKPFPQE